MREEFIDALVELDEERVLEIVKKRLESGEDPVEILQDIREAAEKIGKKFEEGQYFVSDLIVAGEILKHLMEEIRPSLSEKKAESKGKIVIGTVEGDVHDIGKNIVVALLEAEGFEVIDLGVDVPPEEFVSAIKEHKPEIVGLSGLLSEAVESMKRTVEAVKEAELRDSVKIIIGGGIVDESVKEYVGADDWADDAAVGVRKIKALVDRWS